MVKQTTNNKSTTKKRAVRKVKTRRRKPESKTLAVDPEPPVPELNGPPVWGYKVKRDFVAYDEASQTTLEGQYVTGATEFTLIIGSTEYSILKLQNAPSGAAKQKRGDTGYERKLLRGAREDFRDRIAGDNIGTGAGLYAASFGQQLNAPLGMIEEKAKVKSVEIVEID
jgi:hypothetical protein